MERAVQIKRVTSMKKETCHSTTTTTYYLIILSEFFIKMKLNVELELLKEHFTL